MESNQPSTISDQTDSINEQINVSSEQNTSKNDIKVL